MGKMKEIWIEMELARIARMGDIVEDEIEAKIEQHIEEKAETNNWSK